MVAEKLEDRLCRVAEALEAVVAILWIHPHRKRDPAYGAELHDRERSGAERDLPRRNRQVRAPARLASAVGKVRFLDESAIRYDLILRRRGHRHRNRRLH